jgi:tetratricopeptide (TPR) repeat protein
MEANSVAAPSLTAAGDLAGARDLLREAIELASPPPLWHRPARDLVNLGVTFHIEQDYPAAVRAYEEAVAVAHATGDEDNLRAAILNTADVLLLMGEPRRASDYARRGVRDVVPTSVFAIIGRSLLAEALLRLDEPGAREFALEAEAAHAAFCERDPSMLDYLERLRTAMGLPSP